MRRTCLLTLALLLVILVPVLLLDTGSVRADDRDRDHQDHRGDRENSGDRNNGGNGGPLGLLTTIPVPGLVVFDISWVDPDTQLYYLADRSNAAIDIIDARRDVFVGQIKPTGTQAFRGFTGNNNTSGPNGVVTSGHWLFVTDAPKLVMGQPTGPTVVSIEPRFGDQHPDRPLRHAGIVVCLRPPITPKV